MKGFLLRSVAYIALLGASFGVGYVALSPEKTSASPFDITHLQMYPVNPAVAQYFQGGYNDCGLSTNVCYYTFEWYHSTSGSTKDMVSTKSSTTGPAHERCHVVATYNCYARDGNPDWDANYPGSAFALCNGPIFVWANAWNGFGQALDQEPNGWNPGACGP